MDSPSSWFPVSSLREISKVLSPTAPRQGDYPSVQVHGVSLPCSSPSGWGALCHSTFSTVKFWELLFKLKKIKKPNTKLAFSSSSSCWWKQPEIPPFYTTGTGSEIWKPCRYFLLSQELPVRPDEKHKFVCLGYPWQKRRQQHLSSPNHSNEGSRALEFWSGIELYKWPRCVLNFSHFSDAAGKIHLSTQSIWDTTLLGNTYISVSVLSYCIYIQKVLMKLLQLHCEKCGLLETIIFLLERGLV